MGSKSRRAATPALQVLQDRGVVHQTHQFVSGSDHFGEQAAAQLCAELGVRPEQIFKTLIVDLTAGKAGTAGRGAKRELATVCVPVTASLSMKKAAVALGVSKVSMARPEDAQRSSGYVTGGISPIGQKTPLRTVIDASAQLFDLVFVSGGRRGVDIGIAPADLVAVTDGCFADVAGDAGVGGRR